MFRCLSMCYMGLAPPKFSVLADLERNDYAKLVVNEFTKSVRIQFSEAVTFDEAVVQPVQDTIQFETFLRSFNHPLQRLPVFTVYECQQAAEVFH